MLISPSFKTDGKPLFSGQKFLLPLLVFPHVHPQSLTVTTPEDSMLLILREVGDVEKLLGRFVFATDTTNTVRHLFFAPISSGDHSALNPIEKTQLSLRPGFRDRLGTVLFARCRILDNVASSSLDKFVRHDFLSPSRMAAVQEIFEQFKKLPDWDRYPLPEVMYSTFHLPKPKPSLGLMESLAYQTPPHQSLNTHGKVEIRKPAEGGVREIKELMSLPVEQTLIPDEHQPEEPEPIRILQTILRDETAACSQPDSAQTTLNPPTADTTTEILPGWDHSSGDPFCAEHGSAPDAPCHDAECSPPSQRPRSVSLSSFPYLSQTLLSTSSQPDLTSQH